MIAEPDRQRLLQRTFLRNLETHSVIASTNDRGLELLRMPEGPNTPLLIHAIEQTAGRGRGANRWWSRWGALLFSVIMTEADSLLPREHWPVMSLLTGLAVAETTESLLEPNSSHLVSIKWPNDVLIDDRKVAGILIETVTTGERLGAVIGVGWNVNLSLLEAPEEIRTRAVSIIDPVGEPSDVTDVLITFCEHLRTAFREQVHDPAWLRSEYQARCWLRGKTVTISRAGQRFTGICSGIGDGGELLLTTDRGTMEIQTGHVESVSSGTA